MNRGGYFDELDGVEEEPDLPPLEEPSQSYPFSGYGYRSSYSGQYSSSSDAGWTRRGQYAEPFKAERRSSQYRVEQPWEWPPAYEDDPGYQSWRNPYAEFKRNQEPSYSRWEYEWDNPSAGNEERRYAQYQSAPGSDAAASAAPFPSADNGERSNWSQRWNDGSWWSQGSWWSTTADSGFKDKDDELEWQDSVLKGLLAAGYHLASSNPSGPNTEMR